jgi:hypothetical protein
VRANLDVYSQAFGAKEPLTGNGFVSKQMLGFLKTTGQVTDLGTDTVRGAATRRYHALVDLHRYAATAAPSLRTGAKRYAELLQRVTGSASLPMDVWIDGRQQVRRVFMQLPVCTPEGKLTFSINLELYDFGPQPAVLAPPDAEVTDITEKLKSRVSQGLQQLSC